MNPSPTAFLFPQQSPQTQGQMPGGLPMQGPQTNGQAPIGSPSSMYSQFMPQGGLVHSGPPAIKGQQTNTSIGNPHPPGMMPPQQIPQSMPAANQIQIRNTPRQ